MAKPHLLIISPASAKANNGNWRTAERWAAMLAIRYQVRIAETWDGSACDAMIALHARRSAEAIHAYSQACTKQPLVVALTGTDLYRDIQHDQSAQRSLELATALVVLQSAALESLPPACQAKTRVIHQSGTGALPAVAWLDASIFKVVMIGHLRAEKDPATFMRAAGALTQPAAALHHIGAALEPELGALAQQTQDHCAHYRWLGPLPHRAVRAALQQSQLMVLTSIMEGGANVIVEALDADVPILASDIAGNRGVLGPDYKGYFPVGDHHRLAQLIDCAASDADFLAQLQAQCRARAPLFAPAAESAALLELMQDLLPAA